MAPPRGSPHFCFRGMLIMSDPRLPAEWEPQDAVMLTWPHRDSDWAPHLDDVTQLYEALVAVIVDYADVIIVVPEGELEAIRTRLETMRVPLEDVHLYPVPSNDTWARDHGPLTVQTSAGRKLLEFQVHGLGNMVGSASTRGGLGTV